MKVIIVDDEQKFITMLAKRLKFRGVDATVVTNGEEAIKRVEKERFDTAVLDIKMPGISGRDLRVKLAEIQEDLQFIFVTGHGCINRTVDGLNTDDVCLSKPLDIDTLVETIKNSISDKRREP